MKTWQKYTEYLNTGEWHVHTSYTDGHNTVFDYCKKAVEQNIPLIAFTEHVRWETDYDFRQFLDDIEKARDKFDLIILSGCEAKVMPGGSLDVQPWILEEIDYPIMAFHSFPDDIDQYLNSLKTALRNPYVNTWAHPGYFSLKHNINIPIKELTEIFQSMKENNVLLEINEKYELPPLVWRESAANYGVRIVRGSDIHTMETLDS